MATRLYFRPDSYNTTLYPGTYPINQADGSDPKLQVVIPNPQPQYGQSGADAVSVHRTLSRTKGSSQTSFAINTDATTSTRTYYISKFISEPLKNITIIDDVTWVTHSAHQESSTNANFLGMIFTLYVWRPSTGARVGSNIYNIANQGGLAEPASANTQRLGWGSTSHGTGNEITGVQDGDVLIIELYFRPAQASATSYVDTWFYNGSTEYTSSNGTIVSDIASYLETSQDLTFVSDFPSEPIDMDIISTKTVKDIGFIKV
jgi:hypothetical protein